jgi:hypothetical protein
MVGFAAIIEWAAALGAYSHMSAGCMLPRLERAICGSISNGLYFEKAEHHLL